MRSPLIKDVNYDLDGNDSRNGLSSFKLCDIPAKFVEKFCFLSKFDCCCGLIRLKTTALLSVNLKDLSWDSSISNPGLSWLLVSGMVAKK